MLRCRWNQKIGFCCFLICCRYLLVTSWVVLYLRS